MEEEVLKKVEANTQAIERLSGRVDVLEEKVEENTQAIERLSDRVDVLEEKMDKNFEEIRKSLLLIEDCVTNKIPALFDGYAVHQEKIETTEKEVENIREVSQNNCIRISVLEEKSEKHSKQISKLLV